MRQIAQNLFGAAALAQHFHRQRGVALAESLTGAVDQQGQMAESGHGFVEQVIEIYLLSGRGYEVASAHNFRDAHAGVVDHHSQLIGKGSVGTPHNEIATFGDKVKLLPPENQILELHLRMAHQEPHGHSRRQFYLPGHIGGTAFAAVYGSPVGGMGC